MKSHKHGSAVYYKYWSADTTKGRKSIVKVFNKKLNKEQFLPVGKIGIQKNYYDEKLEYFFSNAFESKHDEFMGTIKKIDEEQKHIEDIKELNPLIFNLIFRSPDIMNKINEFYQDRIKIINRRYPKSIENEIIINNFKKKGFQLEKPNPNIRNTSIFELIHKYLADARVYPISIKKVNGNRLITCDNPVLYKRIKKIGTIYYMTLNPEYYICFGYIVSRNYYDKMITELDKFDLTSDEIIRSLENQAQTFIIL